MTTITRSHGISYIPQPKSDKAELGNQRFKLTEKIKTIENSIGELSAKQKKTERTLKADMTMLKCINSISVKHGEDASVRLKGEQIKYGEATGFLAKMFNGGRYQLEREAAAQKFSSSGDSVSASSAKSFLNKKIQSGQDELDSLEKDIANNKKELSGLRSQHMSVEDKIRTMAKSAADGKKADAAGQEQRTIFAAIYQSNVGCAALNAEARYQFGNATEGGQLSGGKVLAEYENVHGNNIFSKGNAELKNNIKSNSSHLAELTKASAKALYTPRKENIVTHRGQGMTDNGINSLIEQFNTDKKGNSETVYKLGQFFSTSTLPKVASGFAERSNDDVKVMFKVTGNSSHSLVVRDGLQFENKEGEKLYSPLANFKVTNISKSASGVYQIALQEVPQTKNAAVLPY